MRKLYHTLTEDEILNIFPSPSRFHRKSLEHLRGVLETAPNQTVKGFLSSREDSFNTLRSGLHFSSFSLVLGLRCLELNECSLAFDLIIIWVGGLTQTMFKAEWWLFSCAVNELDYVLFFILMLFLFFLSHVKCFELPIRPFIFIILHMKMCRLVGTSIEKEKKRIRSFALAWSMLAAVSTPHP